MIDSRKVFLLRHIYKLFQDGEVKTIGLYTAKEKAIEASKELKKAPGFKEHPKGFVIDQYELDIDHWVKGFSKSNDEIEVIRRPVKFLKEKGQSNKFIAPFLSKKINDVYLVEHSYSIQDKEVMRIVGVYSTNALAKQAIKRLKPLKGFVEYSKGFNIDKYRLDESHWTEGFITIRH